VDDFSSPKELAEFLIKLGEDEERFVSYLEWRHKYSIVHEAPRSVSA